MFLRLVFVLMKIIFVLGLFKMRKIKMLRNGLVVVMTFILGSGLVQAQNLNVADDDGSGEVTVYGAAQSADGQVNTFKVEQASGDENPLGDPIVNPDEAENMPEQSLQKTKPLSEPQQLMGQQLPQGAIQESLPQNPSVSSETPQQVNSQIQNTLYEAGGRIYDVQSYPDSDVNTIEEPNINPTISTVPSY